MGARNGKIQGTQEGIISELTSRREHQLAVLDCMPAFDRYCLEFFLGNFDVLCVADLIAHDDIVVIDLFTRHGIDLAVFDPVSGVFVNLMKMGSSRAPMLPERAGLDTTPAIGADSPSNKRVKSLGHTPFKTCSAWRPLRTSRRANYRARPP